MLQEKNYPNLSKAPIKTAIIEIRYNLTNFLNDASIFSDFHQYIKSDFPTSQKGDHKDINLNENPNGDIKATITKQYIRDYKFISEDKKTTLLISLERFNLNLGGTYSSWVDVITKFKTLWELFSDTFLKKQIEIKGLSIRYINRIELDDIDIPSKYFNTTIYAEDGVIPETVTSYFMNYRITTPENYELIITQGVEPRISTRSFYLFDIDVIKNILPNDNIWEIFEKLRDHKNKIFFSNITDLTLQKLL
jgi:uncharacterized protein (TIGR04255 family)